MKHLILGGARSGKSRYAEACAVDSGKARVYVATATAGDNEMRQRIAIHKQRREGDWQVIEEPLYLADTLTQIDSAENVVVLDCLTLWLSNCLANNCVDREKQKLLDIFMSLQADIFIVSNEVGSGVVPLGKLSREFVDYSGWLHQELGKICDKVSLIVAGFPLSLK